MTGPDPSSPDVTTRVTSSPIPDAGLRRPRRQCAFREYTSVNSLLPTTMSLTATAQRNAIATASRCLKRSLPSVVAARRTVSTKPYPEFIKLNWFENAFLAVGSGLVALANPRRGGAWLSRLYARGNSSVIADMVATLAETTAGPSLPRLRDIMLKSGEGRQILKERPRINTNTVDMEALDKMPEGSFGKSYVTWLHRCGVTPDTRAPVSISL